MERRSGRLVAVKRGPSGAEGPKAEAEVLALAQVPGVVELVVPPTPNDPSLVTRWVGPRTLADLPAPLDPARAAGLTLAVAATVARLHRLGLVHGAVQADHVVLDERGLPVVCGFGRAGAVGSPHPTPEHEPAVRRPADDVAGLGRLLGELLVGDTADVAREGGLARWWPGRADARARRALLAVAARARVDDPALRPSVAAFADAVRTAAPGASPPVPHAEQASGPPVERRPGTVGGEGAHRPVPDTPPADRAARPRRTKRRPRWRHAARAPRSTKAVVAVALPFAVGLAAMATTAHLALDAWGEPVASRPRAPDTRAQVAPAARTSGGGAVEAGGAVPEVVHAGRRYRVGGVGDVALVGPWGCDGDDLLALLRPVEGTIHLFDRWAARDGAADGRLVGVVPGATTMAATDATAGCARLTVLGPEGPLTTLGPKELG